MSRLRLKEGFKNMTYREIEEQRRAGKLGKQQQEFQKELDMLYETKTPTQNERV